MVVMQPGSTLKSFFSPVKPPGGPSSGWGSGGETPSSSRKSSSPATSSKSSKIDHDKLLASSKVKKTLSKLGKALASSMKKAAKKKVV